MSTFVQSVFLTCTLALLAPGCTCNRASDQRRAELREQKRQAIRLDKADRARNSRLGQAGRRKSKGKANIARTEVGIWLVDQKKVDKGEDPWVKVTRKVGAHRPAKNAVWVLFKGPTPEEEAKGLTFIDNKAAGFQGFTLAGDTVTLRLRGECANEGGTLTVFDHIVKTLEEFPEIEHVKVLDPDGNTADATGKTDSRPACLEP